MLVSKHNAQKTSVACRLTGSEGYREEITGFSDNLSGYHAVAPCILASATPYSGVISTHMAQKKMVGDIEDSRALEKIHCCWFRDALGLLS